MVTINGLKYMGLNEKVIAKFCEGLDSFLWGQTQSYNPQYYEIITMKMSQFCEDLKIIRSFVTCFALHLLLWCQAYKPQK